MRSIESTTSPAQPPSTSRYGDLTRALPARRREIELSVRSHRSFVRAGDISSAGMIFVAARLGLPPRAVALSHVVLVIAWLLVAKAILRERTAYFDP